MVIVNHADLHDRSFGESIISACCRFEEVDAVVDATSVEDEAPQSATRDKSS